MWLARSSASRSPQGVPGDLQAFQLVTSARMAQRVPPFASNAGKIEQPSAPGVDTITLSRGISIFETPTGVCERHSCEMPSTRDASHSQESSRQAKRSAGSIDHACWLKRRRPDQDRLGREQVLLDAAFATLACGAVLSTACWTSYLTSSPELGDPRGLVMISVSSRCARRGASGDHDQTKPLTPQPPF